LADLQGRVRRAVVLGDAAALIPLLVGGRDPQKRLDIHRRQYETSLVTALLDRFPATIWLVGSVFVTEAARRFVRERPPSRPCIAEYGEDFPGFLSALPGASGLPYLCAFAELEWRLSRLSLAVTRPPVAWRAFSALDPGTLADLRVILQPNADYFHAAWAIDGVMRLYLSDSAPDRFELRDSDVWLELRGARGTLQMNRLDRASFAFRGALREGQTLGDAALSALDLNAAFEVGHALAALFAEELVTAIDDAGKEGST
jgi:Putative DNA-binding domain